MDTNPWHEILEGGLKGTLSAPANTNMPPKPQGGARPWPPVMIRDFLRASNACAADVPPETTIGDVADFLSLSPNAIVAVRGADGRLMGVAVDHDVMALIKRDGISALDYPITEALQVQRPICNVTDSPYVVLGLMRVDNWDRVGVTERGRIVGVVTRRDLTEFAGD